MTDLESWKLNEGLSDAKAALQLGISRGFFSKLKLGLAQPSVPLLIRMRRVTGLTFDDLLKKWVEEDAAEHANNHAPGSQLPLPQLPEQSGVAA